MCDSAPCPTSQQKLTAKQALKLAKRASKAWSEPRTAYKCHECGQWHIGHPNTSRRKARHLPVLNVNHSFRGIAP